jgi:hypothetical protein
MEHQKYAVVSMTDEYRSSQTCIFCFKQIVLVKARRQVNGNERLVKVNGAVECVNKACPSFKCNYTIKARDTHSAVAIAIAGASNLLSANRETLPPFRRIRRPDENTS